MNWSWLYSEKIHASFLFGDNRREVKNIPADYNRAI